MQAQLTFRARHNLVGHQTAVFAREKLVIPVGVAGVTTLDEDRALAPARWANLRGL